MSNIQHIVLLSMAMMTEQFILKLIIQSEQTLYRRQAVKVRTTECIFGRVILIVQCIVKDVTLSAIIGKSIQKIFSESRQKT